MKKSIVFILLMAPLLFISCGDDDDPVVTIQSETYTLAELGDSGVSGTATFTKTNDTTTSVVVTLTGTPDGASHPAHIHMGSVANQGGIAVSLDPIDGTSGSSTTTITKLDGADGAAITYEELIGYEGYINIHLSMADLATVVAQGNIGSNVQ